MTNSTPPETFSLTLIIVPSWNRIRVNTVIDPRFFAVSELHDEVKKQTVAPAKSAEECHKHEKHKRVRERHKRTHKNAELLEEVQTTAHQHYTAEKSGQETKSDGHTERSHSACSLSSG